MGCSTKVLGGASVGVLIVSVVVAILGIVIMTSSIPQSNCDYNSGSSSMEMGVDEEKQDRINFAITLIGIPVLFGGILGIFGGALGVWGGFTANKSGIMGEGAASGCAGGFLIIGCLVALAMASVFTSVCDDFDCSSDYQCANTIDLSAHVQQHPIHPVICDICKQEDICCEGQGLDTRALCKESVDFYCDMQSLKTTAMISSLIGAIMSIIASGMGCAACCCPTQFAELVEKQKSQGGKTIVGQPVSSAE
jgi:hypothetical protein